MAGRRLVDVAKLFNASKSVAQKHIALRSNQLDAFNKTSTLAKAIKDQTDRVTLTAAAAIALSQRFSEDVPSYARAAADRATGTQHADIPRKGTVTRDAPVSGVKEGLEQDHHYDAAVENDATRPPPQGELEVEQKEAPGRPLPDGTIPTSGVTLEQEEKGQDTFSERPVSEPPKEPLAEEQKDQRREQDEGIRPVEADESTIPLPGKPTGASSRATESIPSHTIDLQKPSESPRIRDLSAGHDRDVFYARSVESKPASSSQPRSQLPTHTETHQTSDEHVDDKQMNQDVYYAVPEPREVPREDELPEGVNTDIFHSKRVATMLGSVTPTRREPLRNTAPSKNPFIPPQYQAGHGHDAKTKEQPRRPELVESAEPVTIARPVDPVVPVQRSQSSTTEEEMQDLASQLAQDAQSSTTTISEVCSPSFTRDAC
jgi:aarF domain-containing kinase